MKRIIGLIIALAIVFQTSVLCGPQAAAAGLSEYRAEAEILVNLGFSEYFDMDTYDPYSYITNREFLSMLNYVVSSEPITDYETYARNIGVIDSNESLQKFLYPTYGFAARAALGVLGYGKFAPAEGKEEWYRTQARRAGILSGNYQEDLSMRRADAVKFIVDLFDAPVLDLASVEVDANGYVVSSSYEKYKEGALRYHRGIYKIEGVVDATEFTARYDESDVRSGGISVDGEVYNFDDNTADFDHCVGLNCDVYLSKEGKVLSVTKSNRVDEISFEAEDFIRYEKSGSVKYIEYSLEDSDGKVSRASLEASAAVIVNGFGLSSYDNDDFDILSGKYTLYDNDSNGKYDTVVIEEAKTVVIDYINTGDDIMYNTFDFDPDVKTVDIDKDDQDMKLTVIRDGQPSDVSTLMAGEAVDVYLNAKAAGKKRIVKIVAGGKTVTDTLNFISSDMKQAKVGAKEYDISAWYRKANGYEVSQTTAPDLSAGKAYVFYISPGGEIVGAEAAKYDGLKGVYLYETAANNTGFETEYRIKVFEESGEFATYDFAEKIKFNGDTTETKNCFDKIAAQKGGVILIKTNADGLISEAMTATEDFAIGKETDSFTVSKIDAGDTIAHYQNVSNYFEGKSTRKLVAFFNAKTKFFGVPDGDNADEDEFNMLTSNSITQDTDYNVVAYGVDECGIADYIVIVSDATMLKNRMRDGATMMLVKGVSQRMNADGELVTSISGPYDFLSTYTISIAPDAEVYDRDNNKIDTKPEIKEGDLVKFIKNEAGEIIRYAVVNTYEEALNGVGSYPSDENFHIVIGFMSGKVKTVNTTNKAFVLDCRASATDAERLRAAVAFDNVKVFVCETGGRKPVISAGSMNDIAKGDYVFAIGNWAKINTIVVYK